MGDRLLRLALRLLPREWRADVGDDLRDEARRGGHGALWQLWQVLRLTAPLRWLTGGETMLHDVRYAIRSLTRARWFALGAVCTFTLGIGINVAVFSMVDRMLFKPLPYGHADRLFEMGEYGAGETRPYGTLEPTYVIEARRRHSGFVDLMDTSPAAAFALAPGVDAPRPLALTSVTYNALRVLEVAPVLGRDFTEDDARQQRGLALISHQAWRTHFGGATDIIGKPLWAGTRRVEIVGVLPVDFLPPPSLFDFRSDGLVLSFNLLETAKPGVRATPAVVRLKPGVTVEVAEAELATILAAIRAGEPAPPAGSRPTSLRLATLSERMFGRYSQYSWLVVGATGLVLLIACANLASLMLVRVRGREHVAGMQIALGASPARLVWLALLESLILAVAGSVVAVVIVAWTAESLRALLPLTFTRYAESPLDMRVLGFALLLATASALIAGVVPALRATRLDALRLLKGEPDTERHRWRAGASLIAVEAALGVVLVAGAALTARNLIGLLRTDLGYDPTDFHHVVVTLPPQPDVRARMNQYLHALDAVRGLPGVLSVAGANVLPTFGGTGWVGLGKGYERAYRWHITGDYFTTMRQAIVAGRAISAEDVRSGARVGVLSESCLKLVWPGLTPVEAVGRPLAFAGEAPIDIVGVAADLRSGYSSDPITALYMPISPDMMRGMMFAVRMAPGLAPGRAEVRQRVRDAVIEPASVAVNSIPELLRASVGEERFRATLFITFGVVAIALAAVGLYAVQSFALARRRREMGIRLALGGSPRDLRRLVFRESLQPVLIGTGVGLAVAWWTAKFLQSYLHQIDARDPWTLTLVACVLIGTAIMAAWVPAGRAARTDPATVLRS